MWKTYPRGERELEIIRPKGVIVNGRVDRFIEQGLTVVQILCNSEPYSKQLIADVSIEPAMVRCTPTGVEQII